MKSALFPKNEKSKTGKEGILSREVPKTQEFMGKARLEIPHTPEGIEELCDFIRTNNRTSSGNITILTKDELKKFLNLNMHSVLLRDGSILIGCFLSIPFRIQFLIKSGEIGENGKSFGIYKSYIETFSCSTFLNVQQGRQGQKLCRDLITTMADLEYHNKVYASYQMTAFPLTENAMPIETFYRPINLQNSLLLGFMFPGFQNVSQLNNHRMMYKCKMPKNYSVSSIKENGSTRQVAYNFYLKAIENKRIAYLPTAEQFGEWIKNYTSYLVYAETTQSKTTKTPIGFFSLGCASVKMIDGREGRLAIPHLFLGNKNALQCLLSVAEEKGYDTFYCNRVGDLTETLLTDALCISNSKKNYFSFYNANFNNLCPEDLYMPLF